MKFDTVTIAKKTLSTIVGIGTSKIIKSIIENNVPTETLTDKVTVNAASIAIGGATAELTSRYTDSQIDKLVTLWRTATKKNTTEESTQN